MTDSDFRLENFRTNVAGRIAAMDLGSATWVAPVRARLGIECDEWIALGRNAGIYPSEPKGVETPYDARNASDFDRSLMFAWADLDVSLVKVIGLLQFATDSEWSVAAAAARLALLARSGDGNMHDAEWAAMDLDRQTGAPSSWRFDKTPVSLTRIQELHLMREQAIDHWESPDGNTTAMLPVNTDPSHHSSLPAERDQVLAGALAEIDRQYGKRSVLGMGDDVGEAIGVLPTGSIALDAALGIGGLPRGRVVEIYGPESSGKTTLALHVVANAQKLGGLAAFIDAEHALDPEYAAKLGVDVDALLVSQPDTGEQALEIMDMLIGSGSLDVIVIDSVAALVPRAEIEGDTGDSHVGLQARLMSQTLRKITGRLSQTKTTAIFINQLREKIGVFFGSPETTTGGKALKFYASVRIDLRRVQILKEGSDVIGHRTKAKIVKNKMAPPFKIAEFDILNSSGISRVDELIDLGVSTGTITMIHEWYRFGEVRLGESRTDTRIFLLHSPEYSVQIEHRIREALKRPPIGDDNVDHVLTSKSTLPRKAERD